MTRALEPLRFSGVSARQTSGSTRIRGLSRCWRTIKRGQQWRPQQGPQCWTRAEAEAEVLLRWRALTDRQSAGHLSLVPEKSIWRGVNTLFFFLFNFVCNSTGSIYYIHDMKLHRAHNGHSLSLNSDGKKESKNDKSIKRVMGKKISTSSLSPTSTCRPWSCLSSRIGRQVGLVSHFPFRLAGPSAAT